MRRVMAKARRGRRNEAPKVRGHTHTGRFSRRVVIRLTGAIRCVVHPADSDRLGSLANEEPRFAHHGQDPEWG